MNTSRIALNQALRGKWLLLMLGFALAVTSPLQAGLLFSDNFDSYATGTGDTTYKARYAGDSGAPTWSVSSGTGLYSSGSQSQSIQPSSGTPTLIRTNVPINLANGAVTNDIFFKWLASGQSASPQIGLMVSPSGALNTTYSVGGRVTQTPTLDVRTTDSGNPSGTGVGTAPNVSLTVGNWYDLRAIISTNGVVNSFTVVLQLWNSDTNGVVGTGIATNTQTFNNANVYTAAGQLYAAVRASNPGGISYADNFSVNQASPAITLSGTLGAVNTIFGTASPTPATFTNSAVNLTPASGNLTVTPPSGFEVSLSSGSGYSTSLSVPYTSGTLASTNIYVRLAATTALGTYSGNITVSGGGAASQTIATAASTVSAPSATGTTTTVTTSGSPITYGNSVTFTANIAPASGSLVPTGTVQFYTNGVTLGSPVTVTTGASPNGTASISTTNLPVTGSPHTVTANYIATGSFASSAGTLSGGQAVNKATATVTVTPYSATYDGLAHTATAGTVTGVNGETGATVGTVTLSGTTHTAAGSYPGDSWTLTGGANYNNIGSTTISNNISKATPTVLVTGGIYTNNGSAQGPSTFTTVPAGDTGTATWSYVGVNGTAYGPSATPPTAVGTYTAQVTALTADANFNSSASSPTAFSIINIDVLFSDSYTVSGPNNNINFENTLGREAGALFPLSYLTRYTGGSAFRQQLGNQGAFTNAVYSNTNALLLFGDGGVRIDYDFSTVGAPLDIKFSAIVNWFGLPNTNSLIVGNRSDGYDPTNAVFAFQLCKSGTNNIFNNGVSTAGASGTNFGDLVLVNYEVVLSDTAGTGSPFGSGGSKAAYYQGGTLLGTVTLSQLTAGQGYIGFVGGQGNVGEDNLQISSLSPAAITLAGTLGAVDTIYGTASPTPTSFTVSGSNLGGAPGNLTVTPPSGFEVSLSSGSGYSTNLSVPYSSGTLAGTNVYVRLMATATVPGSPYSGNITVSGGGATAQTIATASSAVSKVTPTVLVTVGSYTNNGFSQGPNTFTTIPPGDTGTATWEYVGVSGTTYGPSATPPAAAGTYTAQVTALTADANFNSSTSSPTAFSIANANVLFADNYSVSGSSFNINFQNTLGREAGSLFPLSYLTRYTGADASRQQVGNQSAFTNAVYSNTNALLLFSGGAVRIDYDFSTVGAPLDIKFSTVMNWYGFANTNTLTVGNRADGYDPTNAVFAFQLCKSGTNNIFNNGIATAGGSGTNFGDFVLVNYEVVLSDTAGTGSPFGSGGSKAAYYQNGILLGTATLSQLTAGQGYIGFVGGQGNVGEDNLQITSLAAGVITLTGTLGAVNTTYGTASPTPTSFTVSGVNLTGAPGDLTVTPPAGFEVSLSSGSGYSTSLSVPYSTSTLAGTTVYVRLAATTALGTYTGNIIVFGGGDAKAIATAASTVSKGVSTVTYGGTVSFTYDGAAQTPGITSITGSTGTQTTNYMGTGATTYASVNAPTNAGTYFVSNTVAADANYFGVTNSLNFTINARPITVTAQSNTKVFDGNTSATSVPALTSGTLASGEGFATLAEAYADAAVGAGKTLVPSATVTNSASVDVTANYAITPVDDTTGVIAAVVAQATTTLLLTNSVGLTNYYGQTLVFTAVVQTNSVTAADASSNVVFSLGGTPVWTNAVAGGVAYYTNNDLPAGVTNFTAQYLGDNNYLGSSVTVTQTVLQTAPTLTLTASGITYGQTLASSSLGGSAATNANNAANVPGGFAFADNSVAPNAGTTNVWVIFTPTDTTNYTTVSNTVSVAVGQLGITVGANSGQSKVYGASDPTLTYTNTPLVGSDTFSGALGRAAGETVAGSPYAISQNTLTAGGNYSITFIPANFAITTRPITITAQPNTKVYDSNTSATNVPTLTGTLASGDGFSSLTEAYATATVGTGKTVIPSATITNASGPVTVNYAITPVNDTASVITSALSTNALLSGLSISPGALSQTFNSGTTSYTATNTYPATNVTVTATSADGTASLALSFNTGSSYSIPLTSGVASANNTMSLSQPANVLAVQVVSQDLSRTNVYTVNELLRPSQSVPKLTNSVSGSTLTLTWPADHLGYRLMQQTSNLNKGVSGNINDWVMVANSTAITSTNITIIKAGVTNAYYKLVYP